MITIPVFGTTYEILIPSGSTVPGCEQSDECYIPSILEIQNGDTIIWKNADTASHQVTSITPAEGLSMFFDSSLFLPGETFSHTFVVDGKFDYYCPLHPWTTGRVLVGVDTPSTTQNESEKEITESSEIESESLPVPASFVDPEKDPQYYVNRYYNEPDYREWFDTNHSEYSSIYQAVGLRELICGIETVFVKGVCLEVSQSVRTKANLLCQDAADSHRESQKFGSAYSQFLFNYRDCMEEKIKAILSEPEAEPEPGKTADDVYKMICSSPDGYCMGEVGMNNPDAYGACLDSWIPFCRTYEAKQTPDTNSEILCGEGTIEKNGQCVPERATMPTGMQQKSSNGGGCLIATATFGSELSSQVQQLRELRDNVLLQTNSGSAFMSGFNQFYYSFSPTIADWERQNPVFKEAVKLAITPLITSLSLLNYVDMDSEEEVLGYGIGLILLNVGMYFVTPVGIVVLVRKKS